MIPWQLELSKIKAQPMRFLCVANLLRFVHFANKSTDKSIRKKLFVRFSAPKTTKSIFLLARVIQNKNNLLSHFVILFMIKFRTVLHFLKKHTWITHYRKMRVYIQNVLSLLFKKTKKHTEQRRQQNKKP